MAEVDDVVDGAVHDLKQVVHADQDCKPLEAKIKQFFKLNIYKKILYLTKKLEGRKLGRKLVKW